MKKIRPAFLGILSLSVILVLATGCYRPAAPDVTATPAGGEQASPPETPDVEATAIANATEAAQTTAAQTPQAEEPTETPTEPPTEAAATATPLPTATATTEPATAVPTVAPTATTAPAGPTTYIVQPGDNLFRIALRHGTTVEAIAAANGIANPQLIYVGQELVIPSGSTGVPSTGATTYIVQPGDNLFRIALRYNMSYRLLAEYNGISNPSSIYVGQVLQIPPQ